MRLLIPSLLFPMVLHAADTNGTQPPAPTSKAEQREVCFVIDTTGSMGGLLEGAKRRIWAIANEMTNAPTGQPRPQVRLALVAYRDRGDEYVTRINDLSDDLDTVFQHLQALNANGGGDEPESVNQALAEAVARVTWSTDRNVVKTIFLVGDCPPHMDYADDVKYPDTCTQAAQRGIVINALQCGSATNTVPIWQDIAHRSDGSYAALPQDGGTQQVATPFDSPVAKLNADLAATAVAYGTTATRDAVASKVELQAASAPAVAAERARYFAMNQISGVVMGDGDLVTDSTTNPQVLSQVTKDQLPASLQALPPAELAQLVAERKAKREELQRQLAAELAQRDAWLREHQPTSPANGFDVQVADMVRAQAAKLKASAAGR